MYSLFSVMVVFLEQKLCDQCNFGAEIVRILAQKL